MKIIYESKERLTEDKVVKVGGKIYPKDGWCMIMAGGAASGKGTMLKRLITFEGDYYNVDQLSEIERMWDITNPKTGNPYSDEFQTPIEDRYTVNKNKEIVPNLGNQEFVNELHTVLKPLSDTWEKSILDNPENRGEGRKRLPNIIFDKVAKKFEDINEIVTALKPVGYKIAIVWVLSRTDLAYKNNLKRNRAVPGKVVYKGHLGVVNTIEDIFESGYIENIDDFWIIDGATEVSPYASDRNDLNAQRWAYKNFHDVANCFRVPCIPAGLDMIEDEINRKRNWGGDIPEFNVRRRMAYNRDIAQRELDKLEK